MGDLDLRDNPLWSLLICPERVKSLGRRAELSSHPVLSIIAMLHTGNPWVRAAAILFLEKYAAHLVADGRADKADEYVAYIKANDLWDTKDGKLFP